MKLLRCTHCGRGLPSRGGSLPPHAKKAGRQTLCPGSGKTPRKPRQGMKDLVVQKKSGAYEIVPPRVPTWAEVKQAVLKVKAFVDAKEGKHSAASENWSGVASAFDAGTFYVLVYLGNLQTEGRAGKQPIL